MTALVGTNVLVYRFDPRFPEKQRVATELLRDGIEHDTVRVAHQAAETGPHAIAQVDGTVVCYFRRPAPVRR